MIYLSLAFGGKMRQNPRWIFYHQQTEELLQFDAGRDEKRCVVILLTLGHKNLLHFITTTTTNKDNLTAITIAIQKTNNTRVSYSHTKNHCHQIILLS